MVAKWQSNSYHQNALSAANSSTDSASLLRSVTFRQPTGIAAVARREELDSALRGSGIFAGVIFKKSYVHFLRKSAFKVQPSSEQSIVRHRNVVDC